MMPEPKITKAISMDRALAIAIEKIAQQERRSFTKQVELILEKALNHKNHEVVEVEEVQA